MDGAPHSEEDLLRWAARELPPGKDAEETLEWLLREGAGEKLESIAESARLPAPRVRQRVSRLRKHLRARWAVEIAALTALGVLTALTVWLYRREPPKAPIARDVPTSTVPSPDSPRVRAQKERARALDRCDMQAWEECIEGLDRALVLDPTTDEGEAARAARVAAEKALAPLVVPSSVPSAAPVLAPAPTSESSPPDKTSRPFDFGSSGP